MLDQKLYTTKELAELLGKKIKTIQEWACQGKIPGQIKVGHCYKFHKTKIHEALEKKVFLIETF